MTPPMVLDKIGSLEDWTMAARRRKSRSAWYLVVGSEITDIPLILGTAHGQLTTNRRNWEMTSCDSGVWATAGQVKYQTTAYIVNC